MSDTFKTKHYRQALKLYRDGEDPTVVSKFWDFHKFRYHKTPSDSKSAKEVIQIFGHHRRRASEREVIRGILAEYGHYELVTVVCMHIYDNDEHYEYVDLYPCIEDMRYEKKLNRKFSNVWDLY
jgi:hypothetical protein